jgi:hypothetical protein
MCQRLRYAVEELHPGSLFGPTECRELKGGEREVMPMSAERDFLNEKFRATGYSKISEFVRGTRSELTEETWGALLNRGDKISVRTLMIMCANLNCSAEELSNLLLKRGETTVEKWIKPVQLTVDERELIEKLRRIKDPRKIKLFHDMLETLV